MKFTKQILNIFVILFLLNLVQAQDTTEEEQPTQIILTPGPLSGEYKENDLNEFYDESSIEIECNGTTCTSSSDEVLLDDGKVTISKAGTYVFDGELNGQLVIAAQKKDLVHLVLRNATITSDFGPAIYGDKFKKLVITTEGVSTITDSTNYPEVVENENQDTETKDKKDKVPNACIYISSNLTFNGKGTINVRGNYDEGIRCKKNLKFVSGKIFVVSKGKSIKAKKSISIKQAEINVDSGDTGIKVTQDTDPDEGFIVIDGGLIVVKAVNDGIHAETHLTINDGYVDVIRSSEGIEAQMIDITGGEIYVNAKNDGINSAKIGAVKDKNDPTLEELAEKNKVKNSNKSTLSSENGKNKEKIEGFDGFDELGAMEAEEAESSGFVKVTVLENENSVDVVEEEPLDKENVSFFELAGLPTPPPKNTENDKQVYVRISGGRVHVAVDGMDVDGIDSNGSLYIGGDAEVFVDHAAGVIYGTLASLDAAGSNVIDILPTALVTSSGKAALPPSLDPSLVNMSVEEIMELYPEHTREKAELFLELLKQMIDENGEFSPPTVESDRGTIIQPYIEAEFDLQEPGTPITIKDRNDKVLIQHSPRARFGNLIFTSPKVAEGETYTITIGDLVTTAVAKIDEPETIPTERVELELEEDIEEQLEEQDN